MATRHPLQQDNLKKSYFQCILINAVSFLLYVIVFFKALYTKIGVHSGPAVESGPPNPKLPTVAMIKHVDVSNRIK